MHHSDRGVQYCCGEYVALLERAGVTISMTQENHCYEHAKAERLNGILKQEYGLGETLAGKAEAVRMTGQAVRLYNEHRPHAALGYALPAEVHRDVGDRVGPAVQELVEMGDPAVAAIRKKLKGAAATVQNEAVAKWIAMLDDDSYAEREKASAALKKMGGEAKAMLREARVKSTSPEVNMRIDVLLEALKGETDGDRRLRRAVEVMELVGTHAAKAGLEEVAGKAGTFGAWEAERAVKRLEGKAEVPTQLEMPPGLPKLPVPQGQPQVVPVSPEDVWLWTERAER